MCFGAAYLGIELREMLDKVLGFLGALLCAPLAMIMPTLCHLKLVAKTNSEKLNDIIIIVISLFVMVFCVGTTLIEMTSSKAANTK